MIAFPEIIHTALLSFITLLTFGTGDAPGFSVHNHSRGLSILLDFSFSWTANVFRVGGRDQIAMLNVAVNLLNSPEPEKMKGSNIGAPLGNPERQEVLDRHRHWIHSNRAEGEPADLSRANLDGIDLTDASLQNAVLNQATLRGADLLLADLRGASLLQADLSGANLLGTNFRQADLQGAIFMGAKNLLAGQFAGANLFRATLPESVSAADAVNHVGSLARKTGYLLALTSLFIALACIRIVTISDVQLIRNSSAIPYIRSNTALPLIPFLLFCPVVILGLYVFLHFHLQRLWEAAADMPAILPDGTRLDSCLPWFAIWAPHKHFVWLERKSSSLFALGAFIAKVLLYAPAPVAIFLFWGRYLTLDDLRGTALHISLTVATTAAAIHFLAAANRAFGVPKLSSLPAEPSKNVETAFIGRWHFVRHWREPRTFIIALSLALSLLSIGAILGGSHSTAAGASRFSKSAASWAADALWVVGYDPSAQLTESDVSTKPRNWTGRDQDLTTVRGANLNQFNLRNARAYRAFLPEAHLWEADLSGARLSEADLREANLRQAILRSTALDQANLARTNLREADLSHAILTQADLQDANLSYALLPDSILIDAKLDGATLYGAQLQNATLRRASLRKADLRDAGLQGANLARSDLREAYLLSTKMAGANLQEAHLEQAILTEADLQHADLRGANLQGAILQRADLAGANLAGAQLQGAFGLSASQLCAAAKVGQAQLDETLLQEFNAQCGTAKR